MSTIIVTVDRDDYHAEIIEMNPFYTHYQLQWGDYVANEWTEDFPSLALALMRLANLDHAIDVGPHQGYANNPEVFNVHATRFLDSEIV